MKFIIAGGRDFDNYELLKNSCNDLILQKVSEVVSGEARGADSLGEKWATENKIRVTLFPANWNKYGKSAGYKRNTQMADYADGLIAFWDGKSKGTKHMIDTATQKGLVVHIVNY